MGFDFEGLINKLKPAGDAAGFIFGQRPGPDIQVKTENNTPPPNPSPGEPTPVPQENKKQKVEEDLPKAA